MRRGSILDERPTFRETTVRHEIAGCSVGAIRAASNQEGRVGVSGNNEALALVGHLEIALVGYAHIFEEIANGSPLDPRQARLLKDSTDSLMLEVAQVRSSLQESEDDERE